MKAKTIAAKLKAGDVLTSLDYDYTVVSVQRYDRRTVFVKATYQDGAISLTFRAFERVTIDQPPAIDDLPAVDHVSDWYTDGEDRTAPANY